MTRIWPASSIRELLEAAALVGEASAVLDSPEDASRFRFAIYNYRNQNGFGLDLAITVDGNTVRVKRVLAPRVQIEVPSGTEEGT